LKSISPNYAKEVMARYGLSTKKHLGQNFLIDNNTIKKIVSVGDLKEDETVVEIGPGLGAMTGYLAEQAGQVVCVELDRELVPVLNEVLAEFENVTIVQGDALKTDFDRLVQDFGTVPYKVVANLPYYISTPLVMHLLTTGFDVKKLVLMVQKEVAQRMAAQPGTPEYGSLTVAVQYFCDCKVKFIVPPTVFVPKPAVESAVVELNLQPQPTVEVADREFFFQVVRAAFNKRRKTLSNALANSPLKLDKTDVQDILVGMGLDNQVRGERLSIHQFAALTNQLER